MRFRVVSYLCLAVACYFASVEFGHDYKYEDYKDYLTLISAVSGMVFTIMGIWIAFLYPNAISRIVNSEKLIVKDFSESKSDSKRLEGIVGAILTSSLVMIAALLITLAKIILWMTPIYTAYKLQFKSGALSIAVFITLVQIESVLHVIFSNVMFINDLHFKRQDRQSEEEL